MKGIKKLKLILMILICLSIILVGFCGIYTKQSNSYKDIVPNYKMASDLIGSTVLEFEVDDSSETVYFDKDGNEVDGSEVTEENEENYSKNAIKVNPEENLNLENYNRVVNIMKKRLEFLQADQYRLDLDKKTGKILMTYSDDYPDDIKSFLSMEGKLELIDSKTEDVILSYNDFKSIEATYAYIDDGANGSYETYLNIKLNDSGKEKINNIEKYKTSIDEETQEATTNKFKIMFDSDEIEEVSYDDILLKNKNLRITTAKNLTSNSQINSKMNMNSVISKLATIGKMPVIYNITTEEFINSGVNNYIPDIVKTIIILCAVVVIYLIIRYRNKGVLSAIAFVSNIALFLLLIRVTDISVSLNGFAGIVGLIILNLILLDNILKSIKKKDKVFSENVKSAYIKSLDSIMIMLIIVVVFAFSNMTVINSMGLLVFWGWLVTIIGSLLLTVPMLAMTNKN